MCTARFPRSGLSAPMFWPIRALAALRSRLGWRFRLWRLAHGSLALVTILGTVVHALLIEGAMEPVSKAVLCLVALGAALAAWRGLPDGSRAPRRGK